jgi:hypothetical protein
MHAYEIRPRNDKRSVDLISDVLPFRRLWYAEPNAVVIRDKFGIFCSMECRNNRAHPGFCNACVAATTPTSAGSNYSFNGIGAVFLGAKEPCKTCGSMVRSQWFCVFFIPLFRVGKFRVKYVAPNRYLSRELSR